MHLFIDAFMPEYTAVSSRILIATGNGTGMHDLFSIDKDDHHRKLFHIILPPASHIFLSQIACRLPCIYEEDDAQTCRPRARLGLR